jgi:hypothetical protein
MQQGSYKRIGVKEHSDRVRFDPKQVAKLDPANRFRLIYPKPEGDDSADQYEMFQRKANLIW